MLHLWESSTLANPGKELEGNLNEILKKGAYWVYYLVYFWIPPSLSYLTVRKENGIGLTKRYAPSLALWFCAQAKRSGGHELSILARRACRRANLWQYSVSQLRRGPAPLTAAHLAWQPPHPHETACVAASHRTFSCAQNWGNPPDRNVSRSREQSWRWLAGETGLSGGLRALVSPSTSPTLGSRYVPGNLPPSRSHRWARTHTNSHSRTPTLPLPPTLPTPGRKVETGPGSASTLWAVPAPRGTAPEPPRLRWAPSRGTRPPRGPLPLTDNSWQGLERTAVAAVAAEPAPGLWLMVGLPHPTQKR